MIFMVDFLFQNYLIVLLSFVICKKDKEICIKCYFFTTRVETSCTESRRISILIIPLISTLQYNINIYMAKSSVSPHIYDYIVIGAGISGLQSLEVLTKRTTNVLALESQSLSVGRILD